MTTDNLTAKASIRIHSNPAKAFAAFAEAEQMSRFWFARSDAGLTAGENCSWSLGDGPDAFSFDVRVLEVTPPGKIVIEWPAGDGSYRKVEWTFEPADGNTTILTIEESGFDGNPESAVPQVLDSQGGFNQVIVAAKAWIEHGKAINVVTDHA